jgi:hypothetical protein
LVAVWAVAGGTAGASIGLTLDLLGWREGGLVLSIGGVAAGAATGWAVFQLERWLSASRPTVRDHHGRRRRPVAVWATALPLGALLASLTWLVVVGTVRAGTMWMGLGFAALSMGVVYLFRPLIVRRLLTRAVEAATAGQLDRAQRDFARVARSVLVGRASRDMARLNLGMLAVRRGDWAGATTWLEQVQHPRVRVHACAGLSMVRVLEGSWDKAAALLQEAGGLAQGAGVQGELDGVRCLLVLRRHGPAEALELGQRLLGPRAGALLLGVLVVAHRQTGDHDGAQRLLTDELCSALRQTGLGAMVPELGELLAVDAP